MKKTLRILILLCCSIFILCGCGNTKSKEKPSEVELRKIVEEQALNYKIDGQHYTAILKSFEVEKGQKTSEGHYDAYCKMELTGNYIDVTLYYVLSCAYYDKTGWEIESSYTYAEEKIVVNEAPEDRILTYVDEYMTFVSDDTTYNDDEVCYQYDYNKVSDYYTETGNYAVEGHIYCSNDDMNNREYSWSLGLNEYGRDIVINSDGLSGIWMAEGLNGKVYYITVNNITDNNIDWSIERTTEQFFYDIDTYLMHEYNSGTSDLIEEDNVFSLEYSFPLNVGSEYFYDEVSGYTFSHTEEELVCYFNLDSIESSCLKQAGDYITGGYDLIKLDSYPVFEDSSIQDNTDHTSTENSDNSTTDDANNLSTEDIQVPDWYETDKLVVKDNEACSCGAEMSWGDGIYSTLIYYYLFDEYGYLSSAHIYYIFNSQEEAKQQYDNEVNWSTPYYYYYGGNYIVEYRTIADIETQFDESFEDITLGDLTSYFESSPPWEVVYR